VTVKPKGKCFYCQKEGHWKRVCFRRKAEEARDTNQHGIGDQAGLAFTVLDNALEADDKPGWILDSGASQHLCSTRKGFTEGTYREIG